MAAVLQKQLEVREELRLALNEMDGVDIPAGKLRYWPAFPLAVIEEPANLARLVAVLDRIATESFEVPQPVTIGGCGGHQEVARQRSGDIVALGASASHGLRSVPTARTAGSDPGLGRVRRWPPAGRGGCCGRPSPARPRVCDQQPRGRNTTWRGSASDPGFGACPATRSPATW